MSKSSPVPSVPLTNIGVSPTSTLGWGHQFSSPFACIHVPFNAQSALLRRRRALCKQHARLLQGLFRHSKCGEFAFLRRTHPVWAKGDAVKAATSNCSLVGHTILFTLSGQVEVIYLPKRIENFVNYTDVQRRRTFALQNQLSSALLLISTAFPASANVPSAIGRTADLPSFCDRIYSTLLEITSSQRGTFGLHPKSITQEDEAPVHLQWLLLVSPVTRPYC